MKLSYTDLWVGLGVFIISILSIFLQLFNDPWLKFNDLMFGVGYGQLVIIIALSLAYLLPILLKLKPDFQKLSLAAISLSLSYFLLIKLSEIIRIALGLSHIKTSFAWQYYLIALLLVAITAYAFWQLSYKQFYPAPRWLILALGLLFLLTQFPDRLPHQHFWLPLLAGVLSWLAIQLQHQPSISHRSDILDDIGD